jgi:hypothetical protein
MRIKSILLLAVISACVIGFAKTEDVKPATIHVYRYKRFYAKALKPSVYFDGKQVARLGNGEVFTTTLSPGKHTITSNDKNSGVDLELSSGDEIFIRMDMTSTDMWKSHGALTMMLTEQGRHDIAGLKPL